VGSGIKCGVNVWKAVRDVHDVQDAWVSTTDQLADWSAGMISRLRQWWLKCSTMLNALAAWSLFARLLM
jgi:hypothetical protein